MVAHLQHIDVSTEVMVDRSERIVCKAILSYEHGKKNYKNKCQLLLRK